MVVYLDLKNIAGKEELHEMLAEKLNFPSYYGKNMDALFDILTECGADLNLIFYNTCSLEEREEKLVRILKKVCADAQKETHGLRIRFYP